MKIILIFIFLFSGNLWSAEVKVLLNKNTVYTGEIVSGKVENYAGPRIEEKRIGNDLYILDLNEDEVKVIFLKKPLVNMLALNDVDYLIWNPIEVVEVEAAENIVLSPQDLIIKNYFWIVYLVVALGLVAGFLTYYLKILKPRNALRKERRRIKEGMFAAQSLEDVTAIWKNKYSLIETFPFIEEEFNKFEVLFYKLAFKPHLTDEEKKQLVKRYNEFLDSVRGGNFGI